WMGINYVFSLEAKECAHDINSLMSKSRIAAMTKAGDNYLIISKDDSGVWVDYTENAVSTRQQVGTARLRVEYVTDDPDDPQTLGATGIRIEFNSDGSFHPTTPSDDYYTAIIVSSNGSRTIEMVPYTGHHQVR
ncbi:MAG: hypothetical protein Q4B48_06560, partial [Syntrophomonadaceae bacterium]|nr:hypothetical protein [Syntrophomonadaceae bacterium]